MSTTHDYRSPHCGETRYAVGAICYHADPSDMWTATLVLAPRSRPEAA